MGCFRSVWTLCCLGLITAGPAGGAEPDLEIVVSCAELSPERADELTARIRLLVHSAPAPRPDRLHVECRQGQGQVLGRWSGQVRAQTFEDAASDIEPVLNAVDELLAGAAQPEPPPEPVAELPEASAPEPEPEPLEQEPAPAAAPAKTRTIGGVAFGGVFEPWPDRADSGVGPRLDLAWGAASWAVTSIETLRFGSTPSHRLLSFDALIGVSWGAPFGPEPIGAHVGIGGEWFSASSQRPTGERTASTAFADLGVRLARPIGPVVLWVGPHGRYRFKELALAEPIDARLRRWSVALSVGVALRVP